MCRVPMVAMPQWSDQSMNAKYIEDVWRVGVRVRLDEDGVVRKKELEKRVREVVEGERSFGVLHPKRCRLEGEGQEGHERRRQLRQKHPGVPWQTWTVKLNDRGRCLWTSLFQCHLSSVILLSFLGGWALVVVEFCAAFVAVAVMQVSCDSEVI